MENGDEEARKILIEHNLRLVAHVCKKYSAAKKIEFDDLVSIGSIGLIKGINTYNSSQLIFQNALKMQHSRVGKLCID